MLVSVTRAQVKPGETVCTLKKAQSSQLLLRPRLIYYPYSYTKAMLKFHQALDFAQARELIYTMV